MGIAVAILAAHTVVAASPIGITPPDRIADDAVEANPYSVSTCASSDASEMLWQDSGCTAQDDLFEPGAGEALPSIDVLTPFDLLVDQITAGSDLDHAAPVAIVATLTGRTVADISTAPDPLALMLAPVSEALEVGATPSLQGLPVGDSSALSGAATDAAADSSRSLRWPAWLRSFAWIAAAATLAMASGMLIAALTRPRRRHRRRTLG